MPYKQILSVDGQTMNSLLTFGTVRVAPTVADGGGDLCSKTKVFL